MGRVGPHVGAFRGSHAFNPAATVGGCAAIALEAGTLLGGAYAVTGRLWLPIGIHLGWNFAESAIFGMTVSGDAFGPEASILAVGVCVVPPVLLRWKTVRLGKVQRPAWASFER